MMTVQGPKEVCAVASWDGQVQVYSIMAQKSGATSYSGTTANSAPQYQPVALT